MGIVRIMTHGIAAVAVCAISLSAPAGAANDIPEVLTFPTFPSAEVCRTCHKSIYDEWARSRHSAAWTAPLFRSQSSNYAIDGCLGCHVPDQRTYGATPNAREALRYEGVTCASCHWDPSGMIYGPRGAPAPHPTARDTVLTSANACRDCHLFGDTFTQWQHGPLAQQGVTCQQCHQSAEESLVADGAAARVYGLRERQVAGHLWPGSSDSTFRSAAVTVSVEPIADSRETGGVTVTLQNLGAGHALPTGWYGRRIELDLVLRDGAGDSLASASYTITPADTSHLQPYSPRAVELTFGTALPADGTIDGTLYERVDPSHPRLLMVRDSWPTAPADPGGFIDIQGWPE